MANKTLNGRIQTKIDTASNWQKSTTPLLEGELAIDSTNHELRYGDGQNTFQNSQVLSVTVDDHLDANSTKPVQNKVVNSALAAKLDKTDALTLGESSSTAYYGDKGKRAYDHSQSAHAPSGAQANVIESVKVNNTALTPSSKAVNVSIKGSGATSVSTDSSGVVTISSTDTNTNTTYDLAATTSSSNGNAKIQLKGNNSTTDSVTIKGTGATSVTTDSSGNIIINSTDTNTDTNTTYDLAATKSSSNGNVKMNLTGTNSTTDSVTIKGSGATSVTTDSSGVITISSTDNNTTYSAAGSSLGLVKSGGDVTISNGQITVNGKAPTSHASASTTYGVGNSGSYGHVKLSDSTSTRSGVSSGVAATPTAVKDAYDKAASKTRTATFVVAASNSSAQSVLGANYFCDGTADQVEIQNAINALPAGGGKVILLEGTYNISASVKITKSSVTVEGMGNSTVLKRMFNDAHSNDGDYWQGGIIFAQSFDNIILSDFMIDGNDASYTDTHNGGIKLGGVNFSTVCNVTVKNTKGRGISFFGEGAHNLITNNIITGAGDSGIMLFCVDDSVVSNNLVYNCGIGYNTAWASERNVIIGNHFMRGTGTSSNYSSTQYTIKVDDSNTQNNYFVDNLIFGKNYVNNGASNNTFTNNRYQ